MGGTIPDQIIDFYKEHYATGLPVPSTATAPEYERTLSPTLGLSSSRPDTSVSDPGTPFEIPTSAVRSRLLEEEEELPKHLRSRFPKLTHANQLRKKYGTKREMYKALREMVQTPLDRAIASYRGLNIEVDSRKEQFKKGRH